MAYGTSEQDAEVNVTALDLRVIADRTEQIRKSPKSIRFFVNAWPSGKAIRVYRALLRIGRTENREEGFAPATSTRRNPQLHLGMA